MIKKRSGYIYCFAIILSFTTVFYLLRHFLLNDLFDFGGVFGILYDRILWSIGIIVPIILLYAYIKSKHLPEYLFANRKKIPLSLFILSLSGLLLIGLLGKNGMAKPADIYEAIAIFAFYVVVAPVLEEYLFRHLAFRGLSFIGYAFAAVFSSFFFALSHFSFNAFVFAFPFGMLASYLVYLSGSAKYGLLIHIINNLLAFLILVLDNDIIKYVCVPIFAAAFVWSCISFNKGKGKMI